MADTRSAISSEVKPAAAAAVMGAAPGLRPHFYERPVLKFGSTLVQLPWIVGLQNKSTAAINNLRRLGARRGQAREETQRIEAALARLLELVASRPC